MKKIITALAICFVISACTDPKQVILGPEPLKQMSEQGDTFRKLSEQDRMLLVGYLSATDLAKMFGGTPPMVTGKTVEEVLRDAGKWKEKMIRQEEEKKKFAEEKAAEEKKKSEEAEELKKKAAEESAAITKEINSSVTVAVTGKKVEPKDVYSGRYSALLMIDYAIENKTDTSIKQLKGILTFNDLTGDKVGSLPVEFTETIKPHKTLKTDTGFGWKVNEYRREDIEKIADQDFSLMKATFTPVVIAFDGGKLIKLPE